MTFTETKQKFVRLKKGDTDFVMTDGIKLIPRASVEFSSRCPPMLMIQIQDAMAKGYVNIVAYAREDS